MCRRTICVYTLLAWILVFVLPFLEVAEAVESTPASTLFFLVFLAILLIAPSVPVALLLSELRPSADMTSVVKGTRRSGSHGVDLLGDWRGQARGGASNVDGRSC